MTNVNAISRKQQVPYEIELEPQSIRVIKHSVPPFHVSIDVLPESVCETDIDLRESDLFDEVLSAMMENRRRIHQAKALGTDSGPSNYMPSGIGRYAMCVNDCQFGYEFDPHQYRTSRLSADWSRIVAGLKRDLKFQKAEVMA